MLKMQPRHIQTYAAKVPGEFAVSTSGLISQAVPENKTRYTMLLTMKETMYTYRKKYVGVHKTDRKKNAYQSVSRKITSMSSSVTKQ